MCNPLPALSSNQEEADTKVFLAAKHAEYIGCENVAIFTVDSDVANLACYYNQFFTCRLILRIGSGSHSRIFDIGKNTLKENVAKSLPSLHALSGCDSVSFTKGIGKKTWLKKASQNDEYLAAIATLGEDITVNEEALKHIEKLFCSLYGMGKENDINAVRYLKFCNHEKVPEPHQLPPTKDELTQHVKRANYQSMIWKRALDVHPDIPSPINNGWESKDDFLEIVWMENLPAPESILEIVTCDCRRLKCGSSCQCQIFGLDCTDICKCHGNCENVTYEAVNSDDEDGDNVEH